MGLSTFDRIVLQLDAKSVRGQELLGLERVVRSAVLTTAQRDGLPEIDLVFDGYNDDPRYVHEVPEIVKWTNRVSYKLPETLFFLSPGSARRYLFCVIPSLCSRAGHGQLIVNLEGESRDLVILAMAQAVEYAEIRLMRERMSNRRIGELGIEAMARIMAGLRGLG